MATDATDPCPWFPQAPSCGHGTRTTSCEYADACTCEQGWMTDLTTGQNVYEAYLSQCNTAVEVFEEQQAHQTNRTIQGTEPTVMPAPSGVQSGRINTAAIGFIVLGLLVLLVAFLYWRKRRREQQSNKARSKTRRTRHLDDEERMPRVHPYMMPHAFDHMHPPQFYNPSSYPSSQISAQFPREPVMGHMPLHRTASQPMSLSSTPTHSADYEFMPSSYQHPLQQQGHPAEMPLRGLSRMQSMQMNQAETLQQDNGAHFGARHDLY